MNGYYRLITSMSRGGGGGANPDFIMDIDTLGTTTFNLRIATTFCSILIFIRNQVKPWQDSIDTILPSKYFVIHCVLL